MSTPFKPAGFPALTTYLTVQGCDDFITFLKAAFGADKEAVYRDDQGQVMHAHIYIDDTILEFSEARPEYPAMPTSFSLVCTGCRCRASTGRKGRRHGHGSARRSNLWRAQQRR